MSDKADSPRRPTNMPSGASSLSERIAALQRKSSASSGGHQPRATSDSGYRSGHLSPDGSPSRTFSGGMGSSGAVAGGVGGSGGSNSQVVRDRISRFQAQAQNAGEKPLLPKSAFGSGAGADGSSHRVLRPYPGANAAGGGSGAWGEGVLRPQLTGGTWVGGGAQGGWSDGVRAQTTGGTYGLSQFRNNRGSPSPSPSGPRTPGAGKDAFLELDEPSSPTAYVQRPDHLRRGSSFSEAQLAAASSGLQRPARNGSGTAGDGNASEAGASSAADSDVTTDLTEATSTSSILPKLPDAPQIELDSGTAKSGIPQDPTVPKLPSPPSNAPVSPTRSTGRTSLSSDVEIGVSGASPAKMAALRRSLSGAGPEEMADEVNTVPGGAGGVRSGDGSGASAKRVEGRVPTPVHIDDVAAARTDDAVEGIGRLAVNPGSVTSDEENDTEDQSASSARRIPSQSTAAQSARNGQAKTFLGDGTNEQDSAIKEMQNHNQTNDSRNAISNAQPTTKLASSEEQQALPMEQQRIREEKMGKDIGSAANGGSHGIPSSTSQGQLSSSSSGFLTPFSSSGDSAAKAREAIASGRSKSLRRLPPGRMMSAAEMDASDDEYEPGWASVISRT